MKVLIVTGIFPPDIGGPATYVPQIAEGLIKRGHKVEVVTLSDDIYRDDSIYPFKVIRLLRRTFKPLRVIRTILTLLYEGRNVDVIFVNGLALESVIANFFLKKPLVMKVVGDLAWERAKNLGWAADDFETFQKRRYGLRIELLKALRSWWTRQPDRVIVPSQYLARWVLCWGVPEEKIVVIYNAVEPLAEVGPLPVPLKTPIKAVTVGRLVQWKRVDGLIEALREVPELGLAIVGDGPERPRLEQIARELEVSDRVYFAGQRSKIETTGLMAACDFFVLNSTYEGLPHVAIEAMALGLPVIATAVGGTREVVKHGITGFLVPTDGSLGITFREILNKPLWDSGFRSRIRELMLQDFAVSVMLEKTEAILLHTCSFKRRA